MKVILILGLAVLAAYGQNCASDQFYYNYQCVDNSCIQVDLASLQLVEHRTPELDNVGKFSRGFGFAAAQSVNENGDLAIKHTVSYQDDVNNPLIKPATCLDATIYNIENDFEINDSRKFVQTGQLKPTWPSQIHTDYNVAQGETEFYFFVDITELQANCNRCPPDAAVQGIMYQCFFEMAITLAGIDQASYYFASVITISTELSPNVLNVNWINIIQVDRCLPGTACEVTVKVNSELLFCCDILCTYSQPTQFGLLWINKPFFIEHKITDAAFQSWYVIVQQTVFTAAGFKLYLSPIQTAINPGYTVLEFNTPVAQQGVTIAVTSTLESPSDYAAGSTVAASL